MAGIVDAIVVALVIARGSVVMAGGYGQGLFSGDGDGVVSGSSVAVGDGDPLGAVPLLQVEDDPDLIHGDVGFGVSGQLDSV